MNKEAPADFVRGSMIRVKEYTKSSAVTSRPLWNFTPFFKVKVQTNPSWEAVQVSAMEGLTAREPSYCTRPSKSWFATVRP